MPLYGWIYAFFDYKPGRALLDCEFVGFRNFTRMVADKYALEELANVMKNTFGMSFLGILTSPLPMFFAIFLAEMKCMPFRKGCLLYTSMCIRDRAYSPE